MTDTKSTYFSPANSTYLQSDTTAVKSVWQHSRHKQRDALQFQMAMTPSERPDHSANNDIPDASWVPMFVSITDAEEKAKALIAEYQLLSELKEEVMDIVRVTPISIRNIPSLAEASHNKDRLKIALQLVATADHVTVNKLARTFIVDNRLPKSTEPMIAQALAEGLPKSEIVSAVSDIEPFNETTLNAKLTELLLAHSLQQLQSQLINPEQYTHSELQFAVEYLRSVIDSLIVEIQEKHDMPWIQRKHIMSALIKIVAENGALSLENISPTTEKTLATKIEPLLIDIYSQEPSTQFREQLVKRMIGNYAGMLLYNVQQHKPWITQEQIINALTEMAYHKGITDLKRIQAVVTDTNNLQPLYEQLRDKPVPLSNQQKYEHSSEIQEAIAKAMKTHVDTIYFSLGNAEPFLSYDNIYKGLDKLIRVDGYLSMERLYFYQQQSLQDLSILLLNQDMIDFLAEKRESAGNKDSLNTNQENQ